MSLVQVIEKFQEVSDEQKEKLISIYEDLKSDKDNAIAATIIQSIEREEIVNKKDLFEMMQSLKAYKANEVDSFLDIKYEYNFNPPGDEFPAEYADLLEKPRLLTLKEDGTRMEVDEEGVEIGPLDYNDCPAEGHPEYVKVDLNTGHKDLESSVEIRKGFLPEDGELENLINKAFSAGYHDEPVISELKQMVPKITPEKELEEVFLDTPIGNLLFEPEEVILAPRCVVLIFDTDRSKPPLYPSVGSTFRLKYEQQDIPVSYMETSFTYRNRKFMIFITLDEEY
jgi:hypothetical protein